MPFGRKFALWVSLSVARSANQHCGDEATGQHDAGGENPGTGLCRILGGVFEEIASNDRPARFKIL
jgi:hypothetical protein